MASRAQKTSRIAQKTRFFGRKISDPNIDFRLSVGLGKEPTRIFGQFRRHDFRRFSRLFTSFVLHTFCISGIYQGHIPLSLIPEKGGLWYQHVRERKTRIYRACVSFRGVGSQRRNTFRCCTARIYCACACSCFRRVPTKRYQHV